MEESPPLITSSKYLLPDELQNLIQSRLSQPVKLRDVNSNIKIKIIANDTVNVPHIAPLSKYKILGQLYDVDHRTNDLDDRNMYRITNENLLTTFLYGHLPDLYKSHPMTTFDETKLFIGATLTCVSRIESLSTCFFKGCTNYGSLATEHLAALLYTNDYRFGIIFDVFPFCVLLEVEEGSTKKEPFLSVRATPFSHLLGAMDYILHNIPQTTPQNINAPFVPFRLDKKNYIGGGMYGSVFNIPTVPSLVVKVIDITFDYPGNSEYGSQVFALNETLILSYLKNRQFKHAPQLESFGFFNGIYFYIIMSKVKGEEPKTNDELKDCARVLNELHELGFIHNDAHLGNLKHQFPDKCTLLDFGFAQSMTEYSPKNLKMKIKNDQVPDDINFDSPLRGSAPTRGKNTMSTNSDDPRIKRTKSFYIK